jgi:GTP cyclohydrolase II
MYNKVFSEKSLSILITERAINDLKKGLPLCYNKQLIFSAEVVNNEILQSFIQHANKITFNISKNRANYLFAPKVFNNAITIKVNNIEACEINQLFLNYKRINDHAYNIDITEDKNLLAFKLMKLAELIPGFIALSFEDIDNIVKDNFIVTLNKENIADYYQNYADSLTISSQAYLNIRYSNNTKLIIFRSTYSVKEHYALIIGNVHSQEIPLIRIHSSCYTGDLIGSLTCDCGDQLQSAIIKMAEYGYGIVIYLLQEGRGIGLANKLRSYQLQQQGFDTVEANEILGFDSDERDYQAAGAILNKLSINKVRILSNNPRKAKFLEEFGINVVETVSHLVNVTEHNNHYLSTKAKKLGHNIKFD